MHNTAQSYGTIARSLHWLMALLVLSAFALGLYSSDLPTNTAQAAAHKALFFSLHKTTGVAIFFTALIRIAYAFSQPRPTALHPDRTLETFAAEATHWTLYISLLAVPLAGWVHHAATTGFAPILWPLPQDLPFVPKSQSVAIAAAILHWIFSFLLGATIALHIAGALKHVVIDRDHTLNRMLRGTPAGGAATRHSLLPLLAAAAIYAAAAGIAIAVIPPPQDTSSQIATTTTGNWQVTTGTLGFTVKQMGADVQGSFATWSAEITFDPEAPTGNHVAVSIDTTSLSLGSVTAQAKEPEFFDITAHPSANFTADITPEGTNHIATGTLTLRGITKPITLPFSLKIDGDTATMQGTTTLDRRDFGMGPSYPDQATVGFPVTVTVALTATRK
ncbi:MAG: YceI family protein [Paracoccaceae bacterium]